MFTKAIRLTPLTCFALVLCIVAAGCGGVGSTTAGGPTPSPTPPTGPSPSPTPTPVAAGATTFLYVGNLGSVRQVGGSVSGFKVNADGTLAPVPGSPFKTDSGTAIVRSDPQGRFVFVGEDHITPEARGTNCLSEPSELLVKKVGPASGTLTQVNSITLHGSCVEDMAVDPSGTHLYVGVSNITTSGGSIQGFLIGPAGTLTELPSSPVMVEDLPKSLAMHPTGKFLYAATPSLSVLDRDTTTGALTVRGVFNTPKKSYRLKSVRHVPDGERARHE